MYNGTNQEAGPSEEDAEMEAWRYETLRGRRKSIGYDNMLKKSVNKVTVSFQRDVLTKTCHITERKPIRLTST
jgi:hypothetical protein